MKIKNLIKQITCSHNYVPWANIYGDLIEDFDGSRTVLMCTKCHKRLFINEYIDASKLTKIIKENMKDQRVSKLLTEYVENLAIGTAAVVATRLKCKDNFERDMVDLSMAILYEITEIM